jgi:hypothetical protein
MAFQKRFQGLIKFVVFIFLIFLKNLLQDYLYQNEGVLEWNAMDSGLFFAAFETFDWILFWFFFRNALDRYWKIVLMLVITVFFTTIPDFLTQPLLSYDHENLAIKSVLYFVPFLIYIFLKRSPGQIFLPIMMAFIPLVNLEIANGFSGNLSFLKVFFSNDFLVVKAKEGVFLDLGLATIKSFFWAGFAILFYEINHQFFVLRSWRLNVELPLRKGYLLLVFIVFKTLIYWFLGSLIIALLGNSTLPLFTNKVGLLLTSAGVLGYLIICTLYFRKYMTMFFYDKCGHSNWLYPFFFLPFVDFLALGILLLFPVRHIKRFFSYKYKKELLVSLVGMILVAYAVWAYFLHIRNVPETHGAFRNALLITQVGVPLISALGIILSLKSMVVYRMLLIFLFLMLPYYYFISSELAVRLRIEDLVGIVSVYLNIGLSVAFLYPVLNFRSFLKLD